MIVYIGREQKRRDLCGDLPWGCLRRARQLLHQQRAGQRGVYRPVLGHLFSAVCSAGRCSDSDYCGYFQTEPQTAQERGWPVTLAME